MIRLKTIRIRLLILCFCVVIGLFPSCGAKKSSIKETVKYQADTSHKATVNINEVKNSQLNQLSNLTVNTETKNYGDSLKGSVPIDSNGVEIESAGIKLNAHLTPVKDVKGNIKGYRLNYNLTAKPTGKTNTNSKLETKANLKEASQIKTQKAEENKVNAKATINRDERETKKAFSFPGWVYALVSLMAILALIIFIKPIIKFIKSWTNQD